VQQLSNAVEELLQAGKQVSVQKSVPEKVRYRELRKLVNGEVTAIENNA